MAVKKGLGKGLDSLITNKVEKPVEVKADANVENANGAVLMNINKVEPNREQPRKKFDEDALLELSESIKQFGVLQPLLVTERDDYYEIIAGERRWRAAKLAGVKEVIRISSFFCSSIFLSASVLLLVVAAFSFEVSIRTSAMVSLLFLYIYIGK